MAKHGYDTKGKAKTFTDKGPSRRWVIGPAQGDWWPLFAEAHTLELACWAVDESNGVCEGKPKTCKKCSTVRLIGGPRGGQHVYGDGVIRADLNESCDAMCTGPGLTWAEYEALAALVKRSRVVDLEAQAVGHLFRTQAACEAGASDLDSRFAPVEPPGRL